MDKSKKENGSPKVKKLDLSSLKRSRDSSSTHTSGVSRMTGGSRSKYSTAKTGKRAGSASIQSLLKRLKFVTFDDELGELNAFLLKRKREKSVPRTHKSKKKTFSVDRFFDKLDSYELKPKQKMNMIHEKIAKLDKSSEVDNQNKIVDLRVYHLALMRLEYEESSPEYINCLIELAATYVKIGFNTSAIPHLKQALILITEALHGGQDVLDMGPRRVSEDYHQVFVKLLLNLAKVHFDLQMYKTTMACLNEAFIKDKLFVESSSASHSVYTFEILLLYSKLYTVLKKPEKSLEKLDLALHVHQRLQTDSGASDDTDEKMGRYYNEKAKVHILQKNMDAALKNLKRSINVFQMIAMDQGLDIMAGADDFPSSAETKKRNREGESDDDVAKSDTTSTYSSVEVKNNRLLCTLSNLYLKVGSILFNMNRFGDSVEYFERALLGFEKTFGRNDRNSVGVLEKLSFVNMELGIRVMKEIQKRERENREEKEEEDESEWEEETEDLSLSKSKKRITIEELREEGNEYMKKCVSQYLDLVKRQLTTFGECASSVASLVFLGDSYTFLKKHEKAYVTYEKAKGMADELKLNNAKTLQTIQLKINEAIRVIEKENKSLVKNIRKRKKEQR